MAKPVRHEERAVPGAGVTALFAQLETLEVDWTTDYPAHVAAQDAAAAA